MKEILKKYDILPKISLDKKNQIYGKDFNHLLADLLFVRGIDTKEKANIFLNPSWEENFDPFLFKDMNVVVERILKAVENNEKILIFSDYDTDGIPGGVILCKFFEKIKYKNFRNFIPNRNTDGYGLSMKMAKKIIEGFIVNDEEFAPDLVITVDCGISDFDSGEILKENKIDLIITDHHIAEGKIPKAIGVLNHKVKDEKYPEQILAGAGVVFKLVQALFITLKKQSKINIIDGWEKWLLDLVAVSTVCDMVPLIGENRLFVKYGQKVLAKTKNDGLKRLIEKSKLNQNDISSSDIAFMIGPRINASSRMDHPMVAFLALSQEKEKAIEYADELEKLNNRRKYAVAKIMKDVWARLRKKEIKDVIVIGNKDWPLGVLGLVAGKVADKIQKPTFVWAQSKEHNGELKGSCRSNGEIDIYSLMEVNKEEFIGFGGHAEAGGFEIGEQKIHSLEEKMIEKIKKAKKIKKVKKILDAEITIDDINFNNYNEIKKLEPYGVGNQQPHFLLRNLEIQNVKFFGKNSEHLELSFLNSEGFLIKAIKFFYQESFEFSKQKEENITLVASFDVNNFNGKQYLRLKIEDVFF